MRRRSPAARPLRVPERGVMRIAKESVLDTRSHTTKVEAGAGWGFCVGVAVVGGSRDVTENVRGHGYNFSGRSV